MVQQVLAQVQPRRVQQRQVQAQRVQQALVLVQVEEQPQSHRHNLQQRLLVSSWNHASSIHWCRFSRPTHWCHCASCQWFGRRRRSRVLR